MDLRLHGSPFAYCTQCRWLLQCGLLAWNCFRHSGPSPRGRSRREPAARKSPMTARRFWERKADGGFVTPESLKRRLRDWLST